MFLVDLIDTVDMEKKNDISADMVAMIAGLIFADGDGSERVWSTTYVNERSLKTSQWKGKLGNNNR